MSEKIAGLRTQAMIENRDVSMIIRRLVTTSASRRVMTPMVHKSNLLASLTCAPDYWRYTPTHYKDAFVDDWPDNPFTLDRF